MVRKLSLAIALALGVTPFAVSALGLGQIKSKSGLNQPFLAEIELLSAKNEELADVHALLAPEAVFAKAGVNRPFYLSQLKFEPLRLPSGGAVIRITTREPIREPFLNFLIELNWPKGRVHREYTVLLDPPVTLQRQAPPVQAASTAGSAAIRRANAPDQVTPRQAAGVNTDSVTSRGSSGYQEYGPTRRNDTLWKIATQVRHPGATMEQMMMALFQANPQAFIGNNINNLKVGEIMRVPERETVLALTPENARSAFRDQVRNWRADRTSPVVQAPSEAPAADGGTAPAEEKAAAEAPDAAAERAALPEAELKIARMPSSEEATESAADSVDPAAETTSRLKESLLDAREMRESALAESRELKSKVENLASQLEDLQRLLELKDEQLAKLQLALNGQPVTPHEEVASAVIEPAVPAPIESTAQTTATDGAVPVPPGMGDQERLQIDIPQFEGPSREGESTVKAGEEASQPPSAPPQQALPVADKIAPQVEPEPKPKVVASAEQAAPKPAPVVDSAPVVVSEPGFLDKLTSFPLLQKITSDPLIAAISAGVVVVLGALVWLLTRLRRRQSEEFQESILTQMVDQGGDTAAFDQPESTDTEAESSAEDSFLSDFSPSEIDLPPEETGEVDPLAEADVYISYGRYKQAEELIRQGLERNPGNQEYRLKLFEVLYALKDATAFTKLAGEVRAEGLPRSDPGAWESIAIMGKKLAPGSDLFAVEANSAISLETGPHEELGDFGDLDLGDLAESLDVDIAKEEPKRVAPDAAPAATQQEPAVSDLAWEQPEQKVDDKIELDTQADELDLDLDSLDDNDAFDLKKLAHEMVAADAPEKTLLDLSSIDLDAGLSKEDLESPVSASLELDTSEIERLELPDFDLAEEFGDGHTMDGDQPDNEVNTKLDLARAFLEMDDKEGARVILQEVVAEGSESQKQTAQWLIDGLS